MGLLAKFLKMRVEGFVLLLVFFGLTLLAMLAFLKGVDNNIDNYDLYYGKAEKLRTLDKETDHVFYRTYRYINYDKLVLVASSFEEDLSSLKTSRYIQEIGSDLLLELQNIERLHREKSALIEQFKSFNARVTNAMHYMFDLRKSIKFQYASSDSRLNVLDRLMFKTSQIIMDIPFDQKGMKEDLAELHMYTESDAKFEYFYQQIQMFLEDSKKIKKIREETQKLKLGESVLSAQKLISSYYKANRFQQRIITFSFFAVAFLLLIILIFNYRRVRRTTRELQAFRYAIEGSDNSIVITDTDRKIHYVNKAFEASSGYAKEEVYGHNPNILKSDLMSSEFYREMNETLARGESWQGELINRRKDGELLYEQSSIVPVFIDGEVVEYLAIKLNVTEYREQQKKLQQSAAVYETIGDGIMITDSEKKIISVNPAFVNMFEYSEASLLGREPTMIAFGKHDRSFYKRMWYSLLSKNRWSGKLYNRTQSGKVIPVWLTITVVRDKEGAISNYIAIYTNLEEIVEMEEKADFLAYHDSLTKLPNRAHFEREIERIFGMPKNEAYMAAILFVDLDRFKIINDTLGHQVGDELLVYIARRIKNILRKDDIFARLGGDEFVIILDPLKTRTEAITIADKVLSVVKEPMKVQNYHLHTTASIGIAIYPDDGISTGEIIKHADSAMYYAKEKGKNRYEFYTQQLSVDMKARLDLEQELKHALDRNELYVLYQPQYDIKSGKVSGAEALVRWHSPTLGHVNPDRFITVAEETGAIMEIGDYVLEEACRAFVRWQEQGLDLETIAVNISSTQFRREEMLESFRTIIEKTGISPENLEIEITERFILEYTTSNMTILEELRELGCKISIDDFGTGYSSLSYMKSLPLDTIKIDKSFVNNLPFDTHDAEVSKAIIALSKSLGYRVVAEGVEKRSQENFLREHGCDVGQGFYFAKPMEPSLFAAFVHEKNQVSQERE